MKSFTFFESVNVTSDPSRKRYVTLTVERRRLVFWGMFARREVSSVELPLSAAVRVADDLTQAAMRGYAASGGGAS